eukprot:6418392-Amphidinium_carterae.2
MESKQPRKNSQHVKRLLESCPLPLDALVVDQVLSKSLLQQHETPVSTSLGREIARLRATYCESVFLFHQPDADTVCLKLLVAKCQPTTLVWLKLLPIHVSPLDVCDRDSVWYGREPMPPTSCWSYDLTEIAVLDPFLACEVGDVDVFMTSQFAGNAVLTTHDSCCSFSDIHTSLRKTLTRNRNTEDKAETQRKRKQRESAHLSSSASSSDIDENKSEVLHAVPTESPDVDGIESESDTDVIEEQWTTAYMAMEEEREAVRLDEYQPHEWFRYDLMGGAWNISRSGKVAYGPRVSAKPETLASAFLKAFGVPNSASFEHSTYGEGVAHKLASLWREEVTRKATFWHDNGCPVVWPSDIYVSKAYPPELEFDVSLLNARARARREKILGMPLVR